MKTSVLEVRDMLSVLSIVGVEKRLRDVPGVSSATVNYADGTATVRYDETRLNIHDIKSAVRQSGFRSEDNFSPQAGHSHSSARPDPPLPEPQDAAEKRPRPARSASVAPANSAGSVMVRPAPEAPKATSSTPIVAPSKAAAPATPRSAPSPTSVDPDGRAKPGSRPNMPTAMGREMGHGGKDLPAMVRDTRNRFFICLIFTVPIFLYAPMGGFFKPPTPPFGLELNLWLLFFASAAILFPSWPFFISAFRALKTGTLSMQCW